MYSDVTSGNVNYGGLLDGSENLLYNAEFLRMQGVLEMERIIWCRRELQRLCKRSDVVGRDKAVCGWLDAKDDSKTNLLFTRERFQVFCERFISKCNNSDSG